MTWLAAAALAASVAVPPPALNHVYIVLDQRSFDAIRASPQVAALLGAADAGLPDYAAPAPGADRFFLRGRETYLELFAPTNRFDEPVGKVGIGLGEDRADRFAALGRRWRDWCGAGFSRDAVEYTRVTPAVPWYDSIQCDDTASRRDLALWAMVYRPAFDRWQRRSTMSGRTARRAILAARRGRFDIIGLTLAVPTDLRSRLVDQLEHAGFARRDSGRVTRLSGSGWTLTLVARDDRPTASLLSIAFRTRGGALGAVPLGEAMLRSSRGRTAKLRFDQR